MRTIKKETLRFGRQNALIAAIAGSTGLALGVLGHKGVQANHVGDHVPGDVGLYSHNPGTGCSDPVDPVTVIYVGGAYASRLNEHSAHHGGWNHTDGYFTEHQRFRDAHGCWQEDDQRASNDFWQPRFHQRYYRHRTSSGGPRSYAQYGVFSSATPHHEDVVGCGHAVDGMEEVFEVNPGVRVRGGFLRGREDILKNWVFNGSHRLVEARFWANTRDMIQCDDGVARSDGWVYYITARHPHQGSGSGVGMKYF